MKRISIKNMYVIIKNYRTSAISNKRNCEDIEPKVKSENEIKKIIYDKREEYIQLMMTQSQECIDLCNEINKLEKRLRASYGFSVNEDLTRFPTITFKEEKIDNQLD
jgi:hypothetical protein